MIMKIVIKLRNKIKHFVSGLILIYEIVFANKNDSAQGAPKVDVRL